MTRQAKLEMIARILMDYPLMDCSGRGLSVVDLSRKILDALERKK